MHLLPPAGEMVWTPDVAFSFSTPIVDKLKYFNYHCSDYMKLARNLNFQKRKTANHGPCLNNVKIIIIRAIKYVSIHVNLNI